MKYFLLSLILLVSFSARSQEKSNSEDSTITRLKYPESFQELIKPFSGKVIYLDIMASWCKPCLEELKSYKELNEFFADNDIIKLFITIDEPENIDRSLQILNKNNINGCFVSYRHPQGEKGNKDYTNIIEKMFITYDKEGNMSGMSIPQFLIIDKNGNIVEYKAMRPSKKEELKDQLSSYLKE